MSDQHGGSPSLVSHPWRRLRGEGRDFSWVMSGLLVFYVFWFGLLWAGGQHYATWRWNLYVVAHELHCSTESCLWVLLFHGCLAGPTLDEVLGCDVRADRVARRKPQTTSNGGLGWSCGFWCFFASLIDSDGFAQPNGVAGMEYLLEEKFDAFGTQRGSRLPGAGKPLGLSIGREAGGVARTWFCLSFVVSPFWCVGCCFCIRAGLPAHLC